MDHQLADISEIISNKDPLGLVVLNYELLIKNLHMARSVLENREETAEMFIDKAHSFLNLLIASLDMRFDISRDLMSLYLYMNRLLIQAKLRGDADLICECCDIAASLMDSWRILEKTEKTQSESMENIERILRSFTYKGGKLCEIDVVNSEIGISV